MQRFITALAVCALWLILAGPAEAISAAEGQRMAQSVGCDAKVYSVTGEKFNAYYAEDYFEGPVIVFMGFEHLPETWQRLIAWHEIGHCMQRKTGLWSKLRAAGPYEVEWDADAFAIARLADEGIDGAALNEEVWAAVYTLFGHKGDAEDSHGTSAARITRGNLNRVIARVESWL